MAELAHMPNKSLLDRESFVPAPIKTKPKDRKTYATRAPLKPIEERRAKRKPYSIRKNYGIRPVPVHVKNKILELLSQGWRVSDIPKKAGIGEVRMYKLLRIDEDFARKWALAKEAALEAMEAQILDIADESGRDRRKNGKANKEVINRARLRIDVRKWLMKCRSPQKYGDKVLNTMDGPPGAKMTFTMKFGQLPTNDDGDIIEGEATEVTDHEV